MSDPAKQILTLLQQNEIASAREVINKTISSLVKQEIEKLKPIIGKQLSNDIKES